MMHKSFPLTTINNEKNTVYLPPSIKQIDTINSVSFGSFTCQCTILPHREQKEEVLVSQDVYEQLKIPSNGHIHLFQQEDTIHIGPLIGIFTAGFTNSLLRPIGERSLFFAKILTVQKSVGAFAFVFGVQQINWEKGTINGYFYNKSGWETIEVPFPHVIYDRLPNRKTENLHALKQIKHRLKDEYLIPWFNPGFFNKWEVHQLLHKDTNISRYFPETHKHPTFSLLERMLSSYGHVFLKPENGSLGLGVYQFIYSRAEEAYYCRYRDEKNNNRLRKFSSLEKMVNFLFKNKQLKHYIVQQGISLVRIDEKKVDFRVHTNKNEDGKWQVSAVAAKIAGKGSVTTHLNNGGVVKTVDEIFPNKAEYQKIMNQLENVALTLSESIDEKVEGTIGEIGFDLGIDKNNEIWVFEANSKPGRSIFSHPKLKKHDLLTRQLSMSYALYLTEKAIKVPEELYQ